MDKTTVIIIGGGATGSGILRDLSMRGIPALLLEQGGLCNGTSSRFHGLLHSGGRYAVSDSAAAAECIKENTILRKIGRQCVRDTEGFFVLTPEDDPEYVDKWLQGCHRAGIQSIEISLDEAKRMEPALSPDIRRVFRVPDGSIDGFRLVLHNGMSARRYGGKILTYHEVTGITTSGGKVTGVDVVDRIKGIAKHIGCDIVVNAAGSWSGKVAELAGVHVPVTPDKGTLVIFNHRLASRVINRLHRSSDGDIFVPHGSITILGTTSQTVEDPSDSCPSSREVLKLLECGRALFPMINEYRILRAFAGTRPLYTPGGAQGRSATRNFHISDHSEEGLDGFLTIFGGKFTTFRLMAEKISDIVCVKIGSTARCRTAEEDIIPAPSQELLKKASKFFLPQGLRLVADRLGEEFKSCIEQCTGGGKSNPLMCECEMVSWKEIEYVARLPSTHSLNDIRLRTRLGMGTCQGTFCALRTASALAESHSSFEVDALEDLRHFVQERWKGMRPVCWGQLARESEMTRQIYSGTLSMDQTADCSREALTYELPAMQAEEIRVYPVAKFSTSSDLVVVGAGLAGLTAALAAARQGQKVTLLSMGAGTLNIATAAIDVLGATRAGSVSGDPMEAFTRLPPKHPYVRLGRARVRAALHFLDELADKAGWPLTGIDSEGRCRNCLVPTAIGTEKTTCLVPQSLDGNWLEKARKILVCGITGLRDCTPGLAAHNLKQLSGYRDRELAECWLESPVNGYRAQTALDVARVLEFGKADTFCKALEEKARGFDAVLVPPVLGVRPVNTLLNKVCDAAGCPVVEMTLLPPGVTGLRLGRLLCDALRQEGVTIHENTKVIGCNRSGQRVQALLTRHEDGYRSYKADHFILATGGVMSGGLTIEPARGRESILGLSFVLPTETAELTSQNMFDPQAFAMLGVPVTDTLEPSLDGISPYVTNVRCAGRLLGGFDSVFEKSGNGVALATGFNAAVEPWK